MTRCCRRVIGPAFLALLLVAAPGRAQAPPGSPTPPAPSRDQTPEPAKPAPPPAGSAHAPEAPKPPPAGAAQAPETPKPPPGAAQEPAAPKTPPGAAQAPETPRPPPSGAAQAPGTPGQGQPQTPAPPGRTQTAETPFSQIFAQLAARLTSVVVNISTTQAPPAGGQPAAEPAPGAPLDDFLRRFFGEKGEPNAPQSPVASLGSGFLIDPSGIIVTNDHVVANAEQVTVTLSDDTTLQAKVIGRDAVSDLALLKVEAKGPLPAARWGDSSKSRVGDWILAIGNPFGLGGTVTAGIISAIARDIHSGPYDDFLQTDASINRGNSGGPMFNLDGEVIGVNTAILSPSGGSIGIGFAIPSSSARPIIAQLQASGKVERGWIGARIQPVGDDLAEAIGLDKSRGAMIASIDPDSPAVAAKLQPGDVILDYDGKPIERSRQLPRLVADTPPGKLVKLTVFRDGKQREVQVKVAALNPNRPPPAPVPEKPKPPASVDALGLKITKLTPDLAKQYSLPEAAKGVLITEVPENSQAASEGLRAGDLVVAVGREPVASPEAVQKMASAAKKTGHKNLLVRVERGNTTRFVALPPG